MQLFTAFCYKNHSFYDPQRAIQNLATAYPFNIRHLNPYRLL
jgi:hypothetical protein